MYDLCAIEDTIDRCSLACSTFHLAFNDLQIVWCITDAVTWIMIAESSESSLSDEILSIIKSCPPASSNFSTFFLHPRKIINECNQWKIENLSSAIHLRSILLLSCIITWYVGERDLWFEHYSRPILFNFYFLFRTNIWLLQCVWTLIFCLLHGREMEIAIKKLCICRQHMYDNVGW
jgi:hypothetical protein